MTGRIFLLVLSLCLTATAEVRRVEHGEFAEYIPQTLKRPLRVVVILHGSVGKEESAREVATRFVERWRPVADRRGVVIVAPAFDDHNFGGRAGPFGGYRGMFGRHVGADVFINQVVDQYRQRYSQFDGRFYLYGHSAGGQLVSRYLVTHPRRVKRAVISAASTFAFPDAQLRWTDGMGRIKRDYVWRSGDPVQHVDYSPDPEGWLQAAQIAVTVIVGSKDDTPIPTIEGLPEESIQKRSRRWVRAMASLARRHGKRGRIRLRLVKGVGHDSRKLRSTAVRYLLPGQ